MPSKSRTARTRQRILELLKRGGPHDAQTLAGQLGVSAMAVRQHLYALASARLVEHAAEPRPRGRPAKLWRLSAAADRFFPDGHAALAVDLVQSLVDSFGATGLERLIRSRAQNQIDDYRRQLPRRAPLARRLQKLAELRTAEGYMADVVKSGNESYLLVENHCPICAAATACTGLCAAELHVFQKVLGDDVAVERQEHLLAGARRCAYRVQRK
jgi:predicted ArsR family transcriptional regulator